MKYNDIEHAKLFQLITSWYRYFLTALTFSILYIKMNVCLFVCLYLIQIHISELIGTKLCTRLPLGLEETVGYVWARDSWPLRPFGPFFFRGHCRTMGTRWLPARPFSAIPLYPWFQLVFAWRHRHNVVADGGVIRVSLISAILEGVPLTSRKLHRCRRQSHPPQLRIPYSGGCSDHVTDITFNRAAGPSTTALYLSFQHAGTWTGSMCLQFGTSSDGKEVTKELQLYK